ncbi:hypothetical protein CFU_4263 [Collimonas fungivorans Ter331]|uniref:Uncharacterized protein n=1 Tax=Collimonas fungivorans (strain Ter331) TaxID=1005048 RepID=G0AFJ5_COLFT|nr:hypothetical protein CFU_4263 [Collimonas fungivorans Ter331]
MARFETEGNRVSLRRRQLRAVLRPLSQRRRNGADRAGADAFPLQRLCHGQGSVPAGDMAPQQPAVRAGRRRSGVEVAGAGGAQASGRGRQRHGGIRGALQDRRPCAALARDQPLCARKRNGNRKPAMLVLCRWQFSGKIKTATENTGSHNRRQDYETTEFQHRSRQPGHAADRTDYRRFFRPDGGAGGRQRRAGVAPPADPPQLPAAAKPGAAAGQRPAAARLAAGRPHRHLVAQQCRVAADATRHGLCRHRPGQHQSGLPGQRTGVRAQQCRLQGADFDDQLQDQRLPGNDTHVGAGIAACRAGSIAGSASAGHENRDPAGQRRGAWHVAFRRPDRQRRCRRSAAGRNRRAPASQRPDQHPVHQRHHRFSERRDAHSPQYPEQWFFHRRGDEADGAGPALHSGAAISLLRHGARQPGLPDPWRDDCLSQRRLRAAVGAAGGAGRTLHRLARRAHHVHLRAGPSAFRRIRPVDAAHRHHGRFAVPDRGDETGGARHAPGADHDCLRHDRNQPGQLPEHDRYAARETRVHCRPGAAAPAGENRRSRIGCDHADRQFRRTVHPRLFGDARLLGR